MGQETVSSEKILKQSLPEKRVDSEETRRQAEYFLEIPFFRNLIDSLSDMVLILNETRQIVMENRAFHELIRPDLEQASGLRPGECLNCVHASETPGGCGTTNFCRACGAAAAIYNSGAFSKTDARECRISRKDGMGSLDLKVRATPFKMRGESFTIFVLTDISHEKRRRALEDAFFTDIIGMAWNIVGFAELLKDGYVEKRDIYEDQILETARSMLQEINSRKLLSIAEDNDLIVNPSMIDSASFLKEFTDGYNKRKDNSRPVRLDDNIPDVQFTIDPELLSMVLEQMADNAVESLEPGEEAVLGCVVEEDSIVFWIHNPGEMPEDVKLQMFQRSFSTRAGSRGLGTYSIRLLSERYLNGGVSFTSTAEEGTVFKARYPI